MTFLSSPLRDKVDCFTTRFDFGANCPLHLSIPAYHLPVYASQCLLPHTTQDSVLDCWLSFVKAVITDHSLPCASFKCNCFPFLFNFGIKGKTNKTTTKMMSTAEIGRWKKMNGLPFEIRSERLRDCSMIGPKTKASTKGGASYLYFLIR